MKERKFTANEELSYPDENFCLNHDMFDLSCENVRLDETKPGWRWQLTASGRFAHRKQYVEEVGQAHGLSVIHYELLDGFRTEHGREVRGHLFVMQKRKNRSGKEEL